MGILFIGLALVLLDLPILIAGGRTLDLTPDMVGYILTIFGLRQIGRYSSKFAISYKLCCFATIASGAVFGVKLIVGSGGMGMTFVLIGIAEMILQVALMVLIACGFKEMEKEYAIALKSKWLILVTIFAALGIVMRNASSFVPVLESLGIYAIDISSFAYLALFYFAWENFKVWKLKEEAEETEEDTENAQE